ncbi:MAG TPA: type IV pilus assembly protein PilM [Candidatus Saccharimonadaceae bacterium]|nr:type IV pilus assembly protein PilM [Candidatus Saccharimonadaceae bacterium]
MSNLFYRDSPIIGLDISQTGIKVMSLDPKKWQILGYGSMDLDPTKMQRMLDSKDEAYLSKSLAQLLEKQIVGSLGGSHVVIGVPTSRSYSRTFSIPAKAATSLRDAVELEVDQYIPVPLQSLYLDYEVIERTKDTITAVMAAVPKEVVNVCIAAAEQVGLLPIMIEPSINATARVLKRTEGADLPTLIVDIGNTDTDIAVLDGGVIRVTGAAPVGGNTFTLNIAKKLGVELENAHQLKVLNGLSPGPRQQKIKSALDPSLKKIVTEILKVIRYYNERLTDKRKIEQLLVVGGGSNVPGIGDYFTDSLVMPARVASPWQQLNFGKLTEPAKQYRSRYIAVAGLASITGEEVFA